MAQKRNNREIKNRLIMLRPAAKPLQAGICRQWSFPAAFVVI